MDGRRGNSASMKTTLFTESNRDDGSGKKECSRDAPREGDVTIERWRQLLWSTARVGEQLTIKVAAGTAVFMSGPD